MEIKADSSKTLNHLHQEQKVPLLKDTPITIPTTPSPEDIEEIRKTLIQKAINQTFKSTAHLANLLPTGTVLAFQLLAPVFSNQGQCDGASRAMTMGLVALCAASSFLLSFTDSFRDASGGVCYGLATPRGLWVIDGPAGPPPEEAREYRLRFIDFVHAVMSALVFCAVALFDQSVVGCLYPAPSEEAREVLSSLPVGIGVLCSMLFVVFPTKRHGIGFPLSVT